MIDDPCCIVCGCPLEITLHALRDYEAGKAAWQQLIHAHFADRFFSPPFKEWLMENILNMNGINHDSMDWSILFMVVCWRTSKQRNVFILSMNVGIRRKLLRKVKLGLQALRQWSLPRSDQIQLNTDGAVQRLINKAAAGGVLRYHAGNWLLDYSRNIGCTSVGNAK